MIKVHPSWQDIVEKAYYSLDDEYREFLEKNEGYFPDFDNFLNAFKSLPLDKTKYILFGQDPYPRLESAIGYAFIDGKVDAIFGKNGLSKDVNRATSLRNFIKMLLIAEGKLDMSDTSQEAISEMDKRGLINSVYDLRDNFEKNGILLLNISLIFTSKEDTSLHVKRFLPFMNSLLNSLAHMDIKLILFGNIAKLIKNKIPSSKEYEIFECVHPYNVSFIKNSDILEFFGKFHLIKRDIK